jgi:type I restriction enzyme S subunit
MTYKLGIVGDHFEFKKGLGYLGKYLRPSNIGLIGLNSFEGGGGYKFGGEKEYSGPYKPEQRAATGDLFISTTDITQDGRVLASAFLLPDLSNEYEEVIFSGDIVKAIPVSKLLLPEFLFNLLRVKKYRSKAAYASTGTTVRRIPIQVIADLEVPIPEVAIQAKINFIISCIDEKIRLNKQISETLESLAHTIFKSWFVDFDPVRAKERGMQPDLLDSKISKLFPDSFEDSELGMVPQGWEIKALPELAEFLNGLALQKFPSDPGEPYLPVIKIPQLKSGNVEGAGHASTNIAPKYIVQNYDVLFSWSGALEVVLWAGGGGALNQHLFKVIPKACPSWFIYFSTLRHLPEFRAIAQSKATTMGHIQRSHLSEAKVAIPPSNIMDEASKHIAPLIQKSIDLRIEASTLVSLRGSLLPRLVSGELAVPEKFLED